MATLEDAIYARLTAVSAVTDLVSTRIYPVKKDSGVRVTWPYIIYSTVYTEPVRAMVDDTGMFISSVRFDIWSKDSGAFDSGVAIATAVRGALQRWEGTAGTITVDHVFLDGEFDVQDPEPSVFHRVMDFDFRWFE